MDLADLFDSINAWFQSEGVRHFLLWAKLISFSISFVLIITIVILLRRSQSTWWISERFDSFKKVKLPERMEKEWQKVNSRLEKGDEANLKLAIIEADNMLDEVLKRMGLEGKDMGERLEKMTKQQLGFLDEVWSAHRLRNLIVHQSDVVISKEQAEEAIGSFEKALKELEVI
ncbi:MAG: hypothetical protein HY764_04710 [Candidatus Portnoybacteria bacterium]|nr:hypothetical protein [Candidatus Portnoybacteria bacterium]